MFIYGQLKYIVQAITVAIIATFFIAPLINRKFEIADSSYLIIFLSTFTTYVLYNLYYTYKERRIMNEILTILKNIEKREIIKVK